MKLTLKNVSKLYAKTFDYFDKNYSKSFAEHLKHRFEDNFWSIMSQHNKLTKITKQQIDILTSKILIITV